MKDNKNILEIYKKRKYNEFLIEKRAKIEELENNDVIGKFVKESNENYKKLYEEVFGNTLEFEMYVGYKLTPKTVEAMDKVEKEFKDKMDDRDRLIEEVQAQVDIVETYEQEIAIYKKYGILDEDGKVYDYK